MKCSAPGCRQRADVRGMCRSHYNAWYRSGEFVKLPPAAMVGHKPCAMCGVNPRWDHRSMCRECHNAKQRKAYRDAVGFKPCGTPGCPKHAAQAGFCHDCHQTRPRPLCACGGKVFAGGMCAKCYNRKRRAEHPMPGCKPPRSRHEYSVRGRCVHCGFDRSERKR